MGYALALDQGWTQLEKLTQDKKHSLRFLNDTYSIELDEKKILSLSCNVPTKVHYSILILHYLAKKLSGLPAVSGEWISFKQLAGGPGYYPAFKKRVIDTIMRKYSAHPETLLDLPERFCARKTQLADISITLDTFENLPVLINFWRADEEFGPQLNVLFDKSISDIFCTEDIVVLAEIVAKGI